MRKEYMGETSVPLDEWFEHGEAKLWHENLPVRLCCCEVPSDLAVDHSTSALYPKKAACVRLCFVADRVSACRWCGARGVDSTGQNHFRDDGAAGDDKCRWGQ